MAKKDYVGRKDFYYTLELPKDANTKQIRDAFIGLAKKYHPDVNDDPNAEERFKAINEAYQILSDPEKRQTYDRFGHSGLEQVVNNSRASQNSSSPLSSIIAEMMQDLFMGGFPQGGFYGPRKGFEYQKKSPLEEAIDFLKIRINARNYEGAREFIVEKIGSKHYEEIKMSVFNALYENIHDCFKYSLRFDRLSEDLTQIEDYCKLFGHDYYNIIVGGVGKTIRDGIISGIENELGAGPVGYIDLYDFREYAAQFELFRKRIMLKKEPAYKLAEEKASNALYNTFRRAIGLSTLTLVHSHNAIEALEALNEVGSYFPTSDGAEFTTQQRLVQIYNSTKEDIISKFNKSHDYDRRELAEVVKYFAVQDVNGALGLYEQMIKLIN